MLTSILTLCLTVEWKTAFMYHNHHHTPPLSPNSGIKMARMAAGARSMGVQWRTVDHVDLRLVTSRRKARSSERSSVTTQGPRGQLNQLLSGHATTGNYLQNPQAVVGQVLAVRPRREAIPAPRLCEVRGLEAPHLRAAESRGRLPRVATPKRVQSGLVV